MLLAHGFLRKVFEVFERYKTSIDMITTSEVAVSLTIDDTTYLGEITSELNIFGGRAGRKPHHHLRSRRLWCRKTWLRRTGAGSRKTYPLRMISYGGSDHNLSLLVKTDDKVETLRSLHNRLF
jgi:aspartate kinase